MSKWTVTLWLFLAAQPLKAIAVGPELGESPRVRAFGLVIGSNVSRDPDVRPLRYADDDAIQNARLLSELGADVVLLVEPDPESRSIYPGIQSTPPTRAAMQ